MIWIVVLLILVFIMWILDGFMRDRARYEEEMLEKESVNNTLHVNAFYTGKEDVEEVVEVIEKKTKTFKNR